MMSVSLITFWIKTAWLFIRRSGRSTLVLSLMVLVSVAALIFLSGLAVGVNDAMIRNSVSLFSGHISGFDLLAGLNKKDLAIEGTVGVLKRTYNPGLLTNKDRFKMISLIEVDPAEEMKSTALWKKTVQGEYPRAGEPTVFLSRPLAKWLNLEVGDQVLFSPDPFSTSRTALTVSGIYQTGIYQLDQEIAFTPAGAVPESAGSWSAAVFLKDGIDPDSIINAYNEIRPQTKTTGSFKSWTELMPDLKQLIDLNYVSMGIVIILVFGVVSLGISCAFVIFILKNLREYGIMKAMGVTPKETGFLIFTEVAGLNLAASLLGVIAGITVVLIVRQLGGLDLTAFTSHNQYFVVSGVIQPRLTPFSLLLPPAVGFLFSLAAAVWPAILIVRKRAADILRIV